MRPFFPAVAAAERVQTIRLQTRMRFAGPAVAEPSCPLSVLIWLITRAGPPVG
jgi:hypothetical protein